MSFRSFYNQFLVEKHGQGNYYHAVDDLLVADDIGRSGYIPFSFSGTSAERSHNDEYPYYLSVSRVPTNDYRLNNGKVTLVLDADKINQKYKTSPTAYYGFRQMKNEAEDRIYSKTDKLYIEDGTLKEIHVFIDIESDRTQSMLEKSYMVANQPLFFYTDRNAYWLMNKRKSVTKEQVLEAIGITDDEHIRSSRVRWDHNAQQLTELVEFLENGGQNPKSKTQKRWRENIRYRGMYRSDTLTTISNVIHNAHRDKSSKTVNSELRHLTRLMKNDYGTTNFDKFMEVWVARHFPDKN